MYMKLFERISKDPEIVEILNQIDKKQCDELPSDHGTHHVMFCVNFIERFLRDYGCTEHEIDLGKVSALMHDLGNIHGKENHAKNGSLFAQEYLSKLGIADEDKNIIVDAIKNHGSGKNMNSIITAALVFADKCHWTKDRFHKNSDLENDIVHKNIKHILRTEAEIRNDKLILTYFVEDGFTPESIKVIHDIKPVFPKIAKYLKKELVVEIKYV